MELAVNRLAARRLFTQTPALLPFRPWTSSSYCRYCPTNKSACVYTENPIVVCWWWWSLEPSSSSSQQNTHSLREHLHTNTPNLRSFSVGKLMMNIIFPICLPWIPRLRNHHHNRSFLKGHAISAPKQQKLARNSNLTVICHLDLLRCNTSFNKCNVYLKKKRDG